MKIVMIIIFMIAFLVLWTTVENHIFRVHSYVIKEAIIPESFHNCRILYLADLHNTSYGKYNKRLKKAIEKAEPDYVIIGGDMLSRPDFTFDKAIDLLTFLDQRYLVYFTNGNHETRMKAHPQMYRNTYQDFMAMAKGLKSVTFLNNDSCQIVRQGKSGKEHIKLYGLELPEEYFKKRGKCSPEVKEIVKYLGKPREKEYDILLAHSPNFFEVYDQWGANLVLSGHNHGGMARIPFVGGVLSTQAGLFPKYTKGLYSGQKSKMIVSAGMGSHTIKVRYFNPPELLMITLKKDES